MHRLSDNIRPPSPARRRWLGLTLGSLGAPLVHATRDCQPGPAPALTLCQVGINPASAESLARIQPPSSQWCWAACLEMSFAHAGYELPMTRIVSETFGGLLVDRPVDAPTLVRQLSRRWQDDTGRAFDVRCEVLWNQDSGEAVPLPAAQAARHLAENRPLILGTRHHAMLLTALSFTHTGSPESLAITSAVVRDPAPESGGRRILRASEVAATALLIVPLLSPI